MFAHLGPGPCTREKGELNDRRRRESNPHCFHYTGIQPPEGDGTEGRVRIVSRRGPHDNPVSSPKKCKQP